ncbi:MAG: TonB-dependent receptor [Chitinophagaceae bacterium]|jgi:TonB-linked SusC/RagA family outer membrane protein|nr:TonB-dependent receptor [Chitinophagaceae bacterium]MCA6478477.1 TonB-dependent receptor [Chitinophagaceae bacterium]MCA6479228.1 TonB-dependent receptor [Chitinophagaceae bacterium]MCA6491230.1 TonB-dependent receptor [Chitinophagaceae bacterium]MCA6512429.1 TonB-dependent receptor [Chitinophagaceae bacterium]
MKRKNLLLILLLVLFGRISAQTITVTGRVVNNSSSESLVGALVTVKGGTSKTLTDANGRFSLTNVPSGSVLVISYVGMSTAEVKATGTNMLIELSSGSATLSDVVVVGYGTQKVTKVSGAISTVKGADIEKLRPVRTEEALQGRAAGVNVIQSGSPGAKPTVLIRGIPSYSGTDPVVIIDGVPQTLTDLNAINASEIESINVLKDAAASAIFGVKGGNGVIVVTTRSGKKGKAEFAVSSNYGMQDVTNMVGVLNATEYAAMINEGSTVAGGAPIFTNLSGIGVGTNWQDQVFRQATLQTHNISARGGSDQVTYFLSGGFLSQGGIVGGDDKSVFSRGNLTANLNIALSDRLRLILNTTAVILNGRGIQENSFNSVLGSALNFDPTVPVFNNVPNTIGQYGFSTRIFSEIFNPLTKLENTYNKNEGTKLYGKAELQYRLRKGLLLTSRFGYTKYDGNAKNFTPLVFYGLNNVDNSMNADGSTVPGRFNNVAHEKTSNFNYTWESFANYDFNWKENHHFETVLGFSLAKVSGNAAGATRQDVPFNSWEFADFTAATGVNTSTNTNALAGYYYQYFRRNLSKFLRVNYDFQEKYLASLTLRRDGSFAFGTDNKNANFLSGSAGWVISKEKFFQSNWIDLLKLRASYGTVGNENVNPQYVGIVVGGPSYGPTANSNGYTFGDVFYPGSTVGSAANNALRWEKQIQANIGFDGLFFKKKLSISFDWFSREVEGLLFTPSASLYLGTVPIPTANIGSTKTTGYEITLGYNDRLGKKLQFNTSATFTAARNLVTATNSDGTAKIFGGFYFNGQNQSVTVFEKGQTPGYFYGHQAIGIFQNAAEIAAAPAQAGAVPGDIRFADIDGNRIINADDKTKIGDPFPDFTIGWNLNITYGNIDLTAFTYASVGNDVYSAWERNGNFTNKYRGVLARWTGEGSTNDPRNPRYSFTDANSNIRVSSRYVEDGSFIRLKNLQLGYTFPSADRKRLFSSMRAYVQARNLFTLTNYSGFDPEIAGGILDTGVDRGAYPQARTISIGLDIKL